MRRIRTTLQLLSVYQKTCSGKNLIWFILKTFRYDISTLERTADAVTRFQPEYLCF